MQGVISGAHRPIMYMCKPSSVRGADSIMLPAGALGTLQVSWPASLLVLSSVLRHSDRAFSALQCLVPQLVCVHVSHHHNDMSIGLVHKGTYMAFPAGCGCARSQMLRCVPHTAMWLKKAV